MIPITAFISYSHDSESHKNWIFELSQRLRRQGIDAIIDRTESIPGGDLPKFMQNAIINSDKVIVICTKNYVKKANSGKGGAGYEGMIINASISEKTDTNKFIPVMREGKAKPDFLLGRHYVDMCDHCCPI